MHNEGERLRKEVETAVMIPTEEFGGKESVRMTTSIRVAGFNTAINNK